MSEAEFAEWLAYYRIEPWGAECADFRAGIIASTIANCHRDSSKRPEPFKPSDFMPRFSQMESDASDEDDGGLEAMRRLMRHQERRAKGGLS